MVWNSPMPLLLGSCLDLDFLAVKIFLLNYDSLPASSVRFSLF